MDPTLRSRFNAAWSEALSRTVRADLARRLGGRMPPFPVAETPVFFSAEQRDRFAGAAREIVALLSKPEFIESQLRYIPPHYRCPGRGRLPHMAQIDFAVVREADGTLGPRLVELQGFPSLFTFQILLADVWATHLADVPGFSRAWRLFFGDMDRYRAMALLRRTLLGDCDPEHVILLDIRPAQQKTWPDFVGTRRWFGIDAVCPTELERDGPRLFRRVDGKAVPVRRIYYRIVLDELEGSNITLPFQFGEELDVEWVPHPEWWFLWSKSSMLALDHPCVPTTKLVSAFESIPEDLSRFVLKPLYSFAGVGVNINPTRADVEAIADDQRPFWVLQEKVEYAPAFESVNGDPVKMELRMMFVRPDGDDELTLLLNLVRLSRGQMMGVDHNTDLDWTGASVGIWEP